MSKLPPVIGQLVRSCALIGQLRHHVQNFPKVTLLVSAVRSLMTLNFKSWLMVSMPTTSTNTLTSSTDTLVQRVFLQSLHLLCLTWKVSILSWFMFVILSWVTLDPVSMFLLTSCPSINLSFYPWQMSVSPINLRYHQWNKCQCLFLFLTKNKIIFDINMWILNIRLSFWQTKR